MINREATEPSGLSDQEAAARFAAGGANELLRHGLGTIPRIAAEVFREPMCQLLIIAGLIYLQSAIAARPSCCWRLPWSTC